jgi:hypothetical protein
MYFYIVMAIYESTQTVNKSLEEYFTKENLGKDGGLSKAWGKIKVWKFYVPIPNISARKKVLVMHDIHHIVTGYDGNWKGEVSIGAWEVASGCGEYWVAWYFNLGAMAVGLFIYPKHVLEAFIRGMRTQNLYHHTLPQEKALSMQVGELQKYLGLDKHIESKMTAGEILSFLFWSAASLLIPVMPWVFLVLSIRLVIGLL